MVYVGCRVLGFRVSGCFRRPSNDVPSWRYWKKGTDSKSYQTQKGTTSEGPREVKAKHLGLRASELRTFRLLSKYAPRRPGA